MDRADYDNVICSSRLNVNVPFVKVELDGWLPKIAECHSNVDWWVEANPGCEAVRGWISYISFGPAGEQLTAHSVVRNPDGSLIDITPVDPDASRGGAFVAHCGNPAMFWKMRLGDIRCPSLDPKADEAAMQAMMTEAEFAVPRDDLDDLDTSLT